MVMFTVNLAFKDLNITNFGINKLFETVRYHKDLLNKFNKSRVRADDGAVQQVSTYLSA